MPLRPETMSILKSESDLQQTHRLQASLTPDDYEIVSFPKHMVEAVDSLVLLAREHGSNAKTIESEADWKVVEGIFKVWVAYCPKEYKAFSQSQKDVRRGSFNRFASSEERGGAMIKHQLNLPMHFDAMLRAIYPKQKWDKKFIAKIARRFPILQVPESL